MPEQQRRLDEEARRAADQQWRKWVQERVAAWTPVPALDALANQPGVPAPESPMARQIRLTREASQRADQAAAAWQAAADPVVMRVDSEVVRRGAETGRQQLEQGTEIALPVGPVGAVTRAADALQQQGKAYAIAQAALGAIDGHMPDELMVTVANRGLSGAGADVEKRLNRDVFLPMREVNDLEFTRTHGGPILFRQAVAMELADRQLPEDHPRKAEVREWKERSRNELATAAGRQPVTRGVGRDGGRGAGRGLSLAPLTRES